ncbi:uncharacterized protein LOC144167830 [Haemaphysalis longicornis]
MVLHDHPISAVYLARFKPVGFQASLKLVNVDRFTRHKQAAMDKVVASIIRNPFLVKYYSCFCVKEAYVTIMEFIPGVDLQRVMAKDKFLKIDAVKVIMAQLILAVEHMHLRGCLHRDIKISNMLIIPGGRVKVIDFDTTKICHGHFSRRLLKHYFRRTPFEFNDGESAGTIPYMAPEIIKRRPYGRSVDWWSSGVVMYKLMTGRVPFRGKTKQMLREKIITAQLRWPRSNGKQVHSATTAAKDMTYRMLRKNPAERLGSRTYADLKAHPFFDGFNWKQLYAKKQLCDIPSIQAVIDEDKKKAGEGAEDEEAQGHLQINDMTDLIPEMQKPLLCYASRSFRKVMIAVLRWYDVHVAHVPARKLRHKLGAVKDGIKKEKFPGVWTSFWEQFNGAVHTNQALTTTEKFHYLRNYLEGDAAAAIAGLPTTEACCESAIQQLQDRFGDKPRIPNVRCLNLLDVPTSSFAAMLYDILLEILPEEIVVAFHRVLAVLVASFFSRLSLLPLLLISMPSTLISETSGILWPVFVISFIRSHSLGGAGCHPALRGKYTKSSDLDGEHCRPVPSSRSSMADIALCNLISIPASVPLVVHRLKESGAKVGDDMLHSSGGDSSELKYDQPKVPLDSASSERTESRDGSEKLDLLLFRKKKYTKFWGYGFTLRRVKGEDQSFYLYVEKVGSGSPAEKSTVLPLDVVSHVNHTSVINQSLSRARKLICNTGDSMVLSVMACSTYRILTTRRDVLSVVRTVPVQKVTVRSGTVLSFCGSRPYGLGLIDAMAYDDKSKLFSRCFIVTHADVSVDGKGAVFPGDLVTMVDGDALETLTLAQVVQLLGRGKRALTLSLVPLSPLRRARILVSKLHDQTMTDANVASRSTAAAEVN